MDYKYIEQLLDRYWDCETTNEKKTILSTIFSQKDVPAQLLIYRSLFEYQKQAASEAPLGDDFDQKVLAAIYEDIEDSPKVVKAKVVSFGSYLKPLFKAAAVVAMVLTIGDAAQWSMGYTSQEPSAQQMMAADTATIDNGMVTAGVDQTIADSVAVKSLKTMSDSIKPEIAVDHNIR